MSGITYVTKGYSTHTNIPAPQHGYDHGLKNPGFVGSPSKAELLKEYVHAPSMPTTTKYASTAPGFKPTYGFDYENPSPPKYHGPVHGYPLEEAYLIHSGPGLKGVKHVQTGNTSGSNKSWQTAGPTATRHPLTNPTNNINEALGSLEESIHYSPRADPRRRGVLDDLSTRAQPIEPLKRYARPAAFVAKPNDAHHKFSNTGSTINSYEAMRRYRGTLMP